MKENWSRELRKITGKDYWLIGVLVVGILMMVASFWGSILKGGGAEVEYISATDIADTADNEVRGKVLVDVEGAVIRPGVYSLIGGSRMKDALIAAGGYSLDADREYCEKNINLAQEVKDGQKIFIPRTAEVPTKGGYFEANIGSDLVNVNSGTVAQLDTLWGIGPARAEAIIKSRPYMSLEELVEKGAITRQILEKNRERLTIY